MNKRKAKLLAGMLYGSSSKSNRDLVKIQAKLLSVDLLQSLFTVDVVKILNANLLRELSRPELAKLKGMTLEEYEAYELKMSNHE